MAWIHVRHTVADYDAWKRVFDETAAFKQGIGWKGYHIFAVNGDSTDVLVVEEFETAAQAHAFLQLPELHAAMARAGVTGEPEILVIETLEDGGA